MADDGLSGLLVGLGNPGPKYQLTPHNLGFLALDELFAVPGWAWQERKPPAGHCSLWRGKLNNNGWLAAKPLTYMNRSGDAVGPLLRWYGLAPNKLLVVHDDLDLALGTVKFKQGGGAAGHRGISSIITNLGTNAFARLRIGIGRPPADADPAAYVLRKFSGHSREAYEHALRIAAHGIHIYCTQGMAAAMQTIHSA